MISITYSSIYLMTFKHYEHQKGPLPLVHKQGWHVYGGSKMEGFSS